MKILFIHPMPPPSILILQKITYHYGIGSISAVLKESGHATDYLALNKLDKKKLGKKIRSFQPDLIGITVTSNQFSLSQDIASFIHDTFNLPIVLGGVHATVRPEECIKIKGILGICVGEGEYPMLELVNSISQNEQLSTDNLKIENFWFNVDGGILKNPMRSLVQDLDSLPFCDREIINFQDLLNYHKYLEVRGSRGCPYKCAFCVNASYQSIYKNSGKFYRTRSPENLLAEIESLVSKYKNIRTIVFDDELMSVNKKWTLSLLEKYKQKFDFPFNLTIRANLVDAEFVKALKEAGCNTLMMGVENGDDYIRNKVLNKGISSEQIIEAGRMIKEAGIKLWTFNMVGVPYETTETIKKTIDINKKIKPDIVFVSTFYPFPGTRLGDLCKKEGWISERQIKGFFSNVTVLDQPSISKEDVAYYHNIFPWAILYPRFLFFIKILNWIKIARGKSVYDYLFPVIKSIYEVYYRVKITLKL